MNSIYNLNSHSIIKTINKNQRILEQIQKLTDIYKNFVTNQLKMLLKQTKKATSSCPIGGSGSQSVSTKPSKQLIQFLARQLSILRDVSQSLSNSNTHYTTSQSRLNECVHLLEKRFAYWFQFYDSQSNMKSNNNYDNSLATTKQQQSSQEYHDYVQDFYENQLASLRSQLNYSRIQADRLKAEFSQMDRKYRELLIQREKMVEMGVTFGMGSSRKKQDIQCYQQNTKLKKQLDHCLLLLAQNTALIDEQSTTISNLTQSLSQTRNKSSTTISEYQQKLLQFDNKMNQAQSQYSMLYSSLSHQHKQYQQQLKQLTLTKNRVHSEKKQLEKQLEIKVEEIGLLAKKVYEAELFRNKIQRQLAIREREVIQLQAIISQMRDDILRGRKDGDKNSIREIKGQIGILEDRLKIVNQTNQQLQNQLGAVTSKLHSTQTHLSSVTQSLTTSQSSLTACQQSLTALQHKYSALQQTHSQTLQSLAHCKDNAQYLQQELLKEKERYRGLQARQREEKKGIRVQITKEVNELVDLVTKKQSQISKLQGKIGQLQRELNRERKGRGEVAGNFEKMNKLMVEIQNKMQYIQKQNKQLNETKYLLQNELQSMSSQVQQLQKSQLEFQQLKICHKQALAQLECLKCSQPNPQSQASSIVSQLQSQISDLSLKCQQLQQQRKQYKQLVNKKDFQTKQLESKIKILQEQLRDSSKCFQNEKFKMGVKIKQLEELLRQRYELSGRFSSHDN